MSLVSTIPVSYTDPARFSRDVYAAFRHLGLSPNSALILTAHVALSTGWGKSMDNYMLTGIKAGNACVCSGTCLPSYSGPYICKKGFEYINGKKVDAVMPFRAYKTLDEGAAATLSLLKSSRYAKSYAFLMAGDTRYFRQLGADGWYTADPSEVESGCLSRMKTIAKYLGTSTSTPSSTSGGLFTVINILLGGVVVASAVLIRRNIWPR